MQVSDLSKPVTAAKAHWVAGEGALSFSPTDLSTNAIARCASAVVRQARNGYILDYVTRQIETPNEGYEDDPEYLRAVEEHERVAGRLIAVHQLRPGNGRSQRQIMGDAEYEKLQNMWARDGNRCRWAVAFPIVETFDIPDQPDAAEIFGRDSYLRLFAHPANLLRPLTDDERAKLAALTITSRPATNAWIAIEDETAIALRDEPAIPANIKRNIEIDFNRAAVEGMSEERRVKVRARAAWNAWKFVRNRQKVGRLTCDDCGFNPIDRIGDSDIKPRSLLDVHHRDPLSEGVRYTRPTDEFFALLCPNCHRLEHLMLRLRP
jgi:5-methylcytosine-specific restriction protein A